MLKLTSLTPEDINSIADAVHENAKNKGFHDPSESDDLFIIKHTNLLHEEVSELFSAHRSGKFNAPCDKAGKMVELGLKPLTCAEEEYADVIIRALDQCRRLGIDILEAIQVKHTYNTTRPHLHGKKY
jgi:NTP pyrophosphatase (non-canonical NTP hydrolase)